LTLDDIRSNNNEALKNATSHSFIDIIELFISKGLTIEDIRSSSGALKNAILLGYSKVVEFFIKQGLTIEDIRSNNNEMLKCAARHRNLNVVKLFMTKGLTIDDLKSDDNEALKVAVRNDNIHIIELFLSLGLNQQDLISGLNIDGYIKLEMFKFLYKKYNLHGFSFENIVDKNVLRYLISKGYNTDKLSFEDVYLI
jgi:ankyrin repeat protein